MILTFSQHRICRDRHDPSLQRQWPWTLYLKVNIVSHRSVSAAPLLSYLPIFPIHPLLVVFPNQEWTQSNYFNWLHGFDNWGTWGQFQWRCPEERDPRGPAAFPRQLAPGAPATTAKSGTLPPAGADQEPPGSGYWAKTQESLFCTEIAFKRGASFYSVRHKRKWAFLQVAENLQHQLTSFYRIISSWFPANWFTNKLLNQSLIKWA